ncbi:hypothetical protein QFZ94_002203 [Paraburkholderia sp. JPY465]
MLIVRPMLLFTFATKWEDSMSNAKSPNSNVVNADAMTLREELEKRL